MSYKRQLFTGAGVNNVVSSATSVSPPSSSSSSSSPPGKDLPEFNIAIVGMLAVGKSGTLQTRHILSRYESRAELLTASAEQMRHMQVIHEITH